MVDQAQNLREFVKRNDRRARVLAVSSGKGGVGKTSTSVNLAIALAARGKRVVVLDADLGLANVEVLLGLNSLYNLQHIIEGEKTIGQILVRGPGGIELVPGTSGLSKLADLNAQQRQRIITGLDELQDRADFVIIDTMAGIGLNAVSFAAAADEVLLVTSPEPSAIVDGYAMIKAIHSLDPNAVFRLVVNMVGTQQQAAAVSANLARVTQQYLNHQITLLGHIVRDQHVSHGVMQTYPFVLRYPNAPASKCIHDIATRVIQRRAETKSGRSGFFQRFAQTLGIASNG